jgi:gas vesicle protein
VELEPKQRNALIVGALIGAMLGAGTGWLLAQPVEGALGEAKKPIRPGDVLRLVKTAVNLLRDMDDLRLRM